jgi:glycosyltransferase 2 family protein
MKKTVLTILQVLATIGLLYWVFHDPQQRTQMVTAIRNSDPKWFLLGLLAYAVVEILGITRWMILLRVQKIYLTFWRVASLFLIGLFFNSFLPGGTSGDVVKAFFLLKESGDRKSAALLSIVFDRLVGLVTLIAVSLVIITIRHDWLVGAPQTEKLLKFFKVFLLLAVSGVGLSFVVTGFGLVHKLPKWIPLRDKFIEMSIAYNVYGNAWRMTLLGVLISLPIHIGYFTCFYCASQALKADANLVEVYSIMPIVAFGASVSPTLGGMGAREILIQETLGKLCHIPDGTAKLIGTVGQAFVICWSLLGGIIYLFYRPSEHAKLSDIRHEVEELEHKVAESE